MTALKTDPIFAPEAQEVFVLGERVFVTETYIAIGKGAEGVYRGHLEERYAVVDFDTPSGEPYRLTVPFDILRNLYR